MEYNRMRTEDMLQYCDEALAWEEFGPVDIFFFESVKRILLGQCPAIEAPETDELAGVSVPIPAEELISYNEQDSARTQGIAEDIFYKAETEYTLSETDGKETGNAELQK